MPKNITITDTTITDSRSDFEFATACHAMLADILDATLELNTVADIKKYLREKHKYTARRVQQAHIQMEFFIDNTNEL